MRVFARSFPTLLPAMAALVLVACGEEEADAPPASDAGSEEAGSRPAEAGDPGDAPAAPVEGATPMAERVATIGLLNKRNNVSKDFELRPGETAEEGPVILKLEACERTAPYEFPQETGAFVQIDVLERGADEHSRVFSGWLFKQSPSLNVVEHPVYDVWVKDCAMSFPGDE